MQDLTLNKALPGTTTRQDLDRAAREMAAILARELGRRRTAYRELYLEAATEDGATGVSRRFPCPQGPGKLPWHVSGLLDRFTAAGPLAGLTVRLGDLSSAGLEQLVIEGLTGSRDRSPRVWEKVKLSCQVVPLASLAADRREKMLSFYDPFRQRI